MHATQRLRCSPVVRPVAPGSEPTVAVVSSASPAFDEALAEAGLEALGGGFRVVKGRGIGRERGYLAGTPEERAADLHRAFGDPGIDVVMQIRGGYGCGRSSAPRLRAHRRQPKPFVGMSDITLLHLALGRHAGLVTLWGPNCVQLGRDASGYSVDRLSSALRGEIAPVGRADGSPPIETLVPGQAGPLAGGTTTLLAASLGTPYELETEGRVLLLEDVHVEPYEVDRCLTQLLHAGKLDVAAGFAIAEHSDVRTKDSFGGHTLELAESSRTSSSRSDGPPPTGCRWATRRASRRSPRGRRGARRRRRPAHRSIIRQAGHPGSLGTCCQVVEEIPESNRKPRPSVAGSPDAGDPVDHLHRDQRADEARAAPSVAATGAWRCRCSTKSSRRPKSRRMARSWHSRQAPRPGTKVGPTRTMGGNWPAEI